MENIFRIISAPDNIAIVVMLFLVGLTVVAAFYLAMRNDGTIAGLAAERTNASDLQVKIPVWPFLARKEFLVAILVTVGLMLWSILVDAPLEGPANPTLTPNPAKAPWYFVGLQEMLVYFDPWIAGVVLPSLIIAGLMMIPYLDPNPAGSGYYTLTRRKWAISVFCFGYFLWIALIVIGTFFRGPGWMWFWPSEQWDPQKTVSETNVDLTALAGVPSRSLLGGVLGAAVVLGYFVAGTIVPYKLWKKSNAASLEALGMTRYVVVMFLLLSMTGLVIKMILRLTLNVKYFWVTPWFNV